MSAFLLFLLICFIVEAGSFNPYPVYGIRIVYQGVNCNGVPLLEEQLRIGDPELCFPYAGVWYDARSFRLSINVSESGVNETVVTTNYRDASCSSSSFLGHAQLSTNVCIKDASNPGLSFKVTLARSSIPPIGFLSKINGYSENVYTTPNSFCAAGDAATPSLVLRRTFEPDSCWTQPNSQHFKYQCLNILTDHFDKYFTTTNKVQECSMPHDFYLSKFYLPPPNCQKASSYPGGGYMFSMFTPQNASRFLGTLSLDGYYQSISCPSEETAFFKLQLEDLFSVWAVRTASSTLALCGSLLTMAVIWSMKKWSDATRIIYYLALAQMCYDASFFLPQPDGANVATSSAYIDTRIVMAYLVRVFSLSTLLISNLLAFTVVHIVVRLTQFQIKKWLAPLIIFIALVSLALPLPTLLVELRILDVPLALPNGKPNTQNPGLVSLYIVGVVQVVAIGFNLGSYILVTLNRLKRRGQGSIDPKQQKADPLAEITRRLALYPLIQACTQLPSIWYIYDGLLKTVSDDTFTSMQYRAFEYLYALIAPIAGFMFSVVFLFFHPGALRSFKDMLKRLLFISSTAKLTAELGKLQQLSGAAAKEKATVMAQLLEEGVPTWELERAYESHLQKEASFQRTRREHPDLSEEQVREMCTRSSLGAFLGITTARNNNTNTNTNYHATAGAYSEDAAVNDAVDEDENDDLSERDAVFLETDQDGQLSVKGFSADEIKDVDEDTLSELAAVERRFQRRTTKIGAGGSPKKPPPPPLPPKKNNNIFISMSQILHRGTPGVAVVVGESTVINPTLTVSERPHTWRLEASKLAATLSSARSSTAQDQHFAL